MAQTTAVRANAVNNVLVIIILKSVMEGILFLSYDNLLVIDDIYAASQGYAGVVVEPVGEELFAGEVDDDDALGLVNADVDASEAACSLQVVLGCEGGLADAVIVAAVA